MIEDNHVVFYVLSQRFAIGWMFKVAQISVTISFMELKFRSHSLVDIGVVAMVLKRCCKSWFLASGNELR